MASRRFIEDVCPQMFTPRRSLQIIAGSMLFLSVIATAFILKSAQGVMLPLTAAFVISIMLAPAAVSLSRTGLPYGVSAGLITLISVALMASLLVFAGRPAIGWAERIPELASEAKERLAGLERAMTTVKEVSEQVGDLTNLAEEEAAPPVAVKEDDRGSIITAAPSAVIQFLFTWVLVYFFLSSRLDFKKKLVAASGTMGAKVRTVRMIDRIEQRIGVYMLTMICINACLGLTMGVSAWLLGLPAPHIWGLLAALLNFVPYIGPATLTLLLGLAGIVHYDDPWMAAAPMGAFIALNFIESNFATPMIVGVKMRVTPIAIIISVSLLTYLWGPVGGVLAIPILLIFKTVCDAIPVLGPVSVLIGELAPSAPRRLTPARPITLGKRVEKLAR